MGNNFECGGPGWRRAGGGLWAASVGPGEGAVGALSGHARTVIGPAGGDRPSSRPRSTPRPSVWPASPGGSGQGSSCPRCCRRAREAGSRQPPSLRLRPGARSPGVQPLWLLGPVPATVLTKGTALRSDCVSALCQPARPQDRPGSPGRAPRRGNRTVRVGAGARAQASGGDAAARAAAGEPFAPHGGASSP